MILFNTKNDFKLQNHVSEHIINIDFATGVLNTNPLSTLQIHIDNIFCEVKVAGIEISCKLYVAIVPKTENYLQKVSNLDVFERIVLCKSDMQT